MHVLINYHFNYKLSYAISCIILSIYNFSRTQSEKLSLPRMMMYNYLSTEAQICGIILLYVF